MSYGYNEKEIERDRIVIMDAKWLMPDANKEVSGSAIFLKIQCYGGYEKTKYIFITDDKSITKDCVNETVEKLWPYKKERVYKFIQYDGSETEAVRKATENLPEDAIYMVFLEENLYEQFPGRAEVLDIQNIDDNINKLTRQLKLGYWWDQSYRHSKLRWKDQLVSDEFENVIFLDIDGVLNEDKGDGNIDEEKVALLADIVNQTKSEIVLTSSWRRYLPVWIESKEKPKGSASMLFHLFAKYNLTIADATEDLTSGPDARPFEVRSWLSYRDSVINFVILDDENFWRWNWLAPHVVLTEVTWLGDKGNYDYHRQAGLNQEQANRAIEILQRFKKKKPW